MLLFILKRLFISIPVIFILATLTFCIMRVTPGGPFDKDKAIPPEIKANIEAKYHLDKPTFINTPAFYKKKWIHVLTETQYFYYMKGLAQGDLGPSYKYLGRSVTDIILDSLPVSVELGFYAALILAAYKHNTWIDNAAMFTAISGITLPSFLVAALLIYIFSIKMAWLPAGLWDGGWEYKILPTIALGLRPVAIIARLMRTSMLDVIKADYVRTARAKGLNEVWVILKHVVKNSLIPVITISGPLLAGIITGSFVIEHVFAIPGIAKHFILAVTNRDYTLIMGVTLVYAVLLIIANILVDVFYALVDPRIKLS
ncbi:MAG: ABC transporter permease subunit [Deltaproteobacteria bacterium]|nr:ABC transporter permease subunit [Deltaproteobacteria bacterium]